MTNANATPLVFPTFTEAAFQAGETFVPVERSRVDDPGVPLPFVPAGGSHQRGFFNLGLRPASDDLGNGGTDPYGHPLSIARMFLHEQAGETVVDPTGIGNRCATPTLVEPGGTPPYPGCPSAGTPPLLDFNGERELVDGTFKTPSIRNVGLTPPYFHYGGYSDLRGVVEVYARGGSKRDKQLTVPAATGDWSGTGALGKGPAPATGPSFGTNVDFFIRDVKSTDEQIDALVAFMLTRDRSARAVRSGTVRSSRPDRARRPHDHRRQWRRQGRRPHLHLAGGRRRRVCGGTERQVLHPECGRPVRARHGCPAGRVTSAR